MKRKTSYIKVKVTGLTIKDWEVILAALGNTAHQSSSPEERENCAKLISKLIVS